MKRDKEILVFITTLAVGIPLTMFGIIYFSDNVTTLLTSLLLLMVFIGVVSLILVFNKDKILNKISGITQSNVESFTESIISSASNVSNGEYDLAKEEISKAIKHGVNVYSWMKTMSWLLSLLLGLLVGFGALMGSVLLFKQNELISEQNKFFQHQIKLNQEQLKITQEQIENNDYIKYIGFLSDENINIELRGNAIRYLDRFNFEREIDFKIKNEELIDLNLSNDRFIGIEFEETNLENAKLYSTDFSHATFFNCNLTDTDFSSSNLYDTDLSGSNLEKADFENAQLKNSDLSSTYISNTDFTNANLDSVDFSSSIINSLDLENTSINKFVLYSSYVPSSTWFDDLEIKAEKYSNLKENNLEWLTSFRSEIKRLRDTYTILGSSTPSDEIKNENGFKLEKDKYYFVTEKSN